MLGRPHVSFRGLGHDPRQLVDHVEDTVAGYFVAPLLHLVQDFPLRLVQGQFQPYSGVVREVATFNTIGLYHVLRIAFLADVDGPFLTIAGDPYTEDLRKPLHDESTLIGTTRLNF